MTGFCRFLSSSIGSKVLMAISGLLLCLFVLIHMLGNLQIYLGQEAYNHYAHTLKSLPGLLWTARLGLLVIVATHIYSGYRLALINQQARPIAYSNKRFRKASGASRYMVLSGTVVLFFIIYHLLHFTLGVVQPEYSNLIDAKGQHDVYSMFVLGFQSLPVALTYIVGMLLFGLHLSHGAQSFFQSLGIYHSRYNALLRSIGPWFAGLIVLGNISMPIAVQLGIIQLPLH